MEFKVITKSEEIAVIGFKTAKENHNIAAKVMKERRAKEELERIEREAKEKKALEELYQKLMDKINKEAEQGYIALQLDWRTDKNPLGISIGSWELRQKEIQTFFGNLGYRIDDVYIYSDSWRRQSGKVGYVNISWY